MCKVAKSVFIVLVMIGLASYGVVSNPYKGIKIADYIYLDCEITCDDDQADVDFAIDTMSNLPDELQPFFGDYKIIFVDEISNGASGQTRPDDKVILIQKGYARAILYHEFGHLILNDYAYTDSFIQAYEKEAEILLSRYFTGDRSYFLKDSCEYFCHAYWIYNVIGENMQEVVPNTYRLINGVVSSETTLFVFRRFNTVQNSNINSIF